MIQICLVCKAEILTMAYKGTGACCQKHLEYLDTRRAPDDDHRLCGSIRPDGLMSCSRPPHEPTIQHGYAGIFWG